MSCFFLLICSTPAPHLNILYNPTYIKSTLCAAFYLTPHSFSCPIFLLSTLPLCPYHQQGCLYCLTLSLEQLLLTSSATSLSWVTVHQGFGAALFCFSVITNHGFLLSVGKRRQQQMKALCVGAREGKPGPVCALQARGTLGEKLFCSACRQQQDGT